jgi:hypothetical protein
MEKSELKKIILFGILGISVIGFFVVLLGDFAGFWLTGYYTGERYSCLFCEYGTFIDIASVVLIISLILGQIFIALNESLPKQIIEKDLTLFGLLFAIGTIIFTVIGLIGFGIAYSEYEWWPEAGFYAGIITGLINGFLFALKFKKKL